MNMRRILRLTAAASLISMTTPAYAEYPDWPVEVVVGAAAGSTIDLIFRVIAPAFLEEFGQRLVIANKPGAKGTVGANEVMGAVPDGYTLGSITPGVLEEMRRQGNTSGPARLKFISGLATYPLFILVKSGGVQSVHELIKSAPKDWGYSNNITQLGGEVFLKAAHLVPTPEAISYQGKEPTMLIDLLGGRITYGIAGGPGAQGQIAAHDLKPLAVVAARRSSFFPEIPTLKEALLQSGKAEPERIREPTIALAGPHELPPAVMERLRRGLEKILQRPDVKEAFGRIWAEPRDWRIKDFEGYGLGR